MGPPGYKLDKHIDLCIISAVCPGHDAKFELDLLAIDPINAVCNAAVRLHIEYGAALERYRIVRRASKKTIWHKGALVSAKQLYALLEADLV